jgi:hypothetical protein
VAEVRAADAAGESFSAIARDFNAGYADEARSEVDAYQSREPDRGVTEDGMDKLKEWTERPVDRALEALGYVCAGGIFASGIILFFPKAQPFVMVSFGVLMLTSFFVRYARGSFGIPSESHPATPTKKK